MPASIYLQHHHECSKDLPETVVSPELVVLFVSFRFVLVNGYSRGAAAQCRFSGSPMYILLFSLRRGRRQFRGSSEEQVDTLPFQIISNARQSCVSATALKIDIEIDDFSMSFYIDILLNYVGLYEGKWKQICTKIDFKIDVNIGSDQTKTPFN